ncbi:hypothetical protein U0035_13585 [Niabella yanshanensis]|uniref:Uncharacterized protein n=1 Tax=Niabella yanshanensis TaxID=577386 RepID=A0ABZ0W1B1_9BACT|nr:hypothetical protein [Niabella yanshanensis]WQD36699.1 hypothetical protein U0035_13585 [Niabella yanshanensis]
MNSELKADKSVEISYTNTESGYYTVVLNFSDLANCSRPQENFSVNGNAGTLLTLKPTDTNQHIGYRYIRGKFKPGLNAEPVTKKGRLSRPFVVMMGFGFFDLC